MKITRLDTKVVSADWRNWIFLVIHTDEGVDGLGEVSLEGKERAVQGAVLDLSHNLIGRDPLNIEKLLGKMFCEEPWRFGSVSLTAISGIELALWDILGKLLKAPVYRLLGGKYHEKILLYANGWFSGVGKPDKFAARAERVVNLGYSALKFDPFGTAFMTIDEQSLQNLLDIVEAVKSAVGKKVDILIEGHGRFNIATAVRIARKLERFEVFWFEEPVPPESIEAAAKVSQSTSVPIAIGDRLNTRFDYVRVLDQQAAAIVTPDICHASGIFELKKIAAMMETRYIMVAPHNSSGPISTIASLHFLTCTSNGLIQEYYVEPPWRENIIKGYPEPVSGHIQIGDKPGWGLELSEDEIDKHPLKETHLNIYEANYKYGTLNS